jgi:hypothetical protein
MATRQALVDGARPISLRLGGSGDIRQAVARPARMAVNHVR